MKKKILAFAIMAIAAVSAGNLFAQQPQAKEQTCPAQCQKARCADPLAAFQGITLTADQKAQITKINDQMVAERQKAKLEQDAAKLKAREVRQEKDSVMRAKRMQERLDYLHQVQKVLTPQQYVTFLENTAVQQNLPGKGFKPGKGAKAGKDMKQGRGRHGKFQGMMKGKDGKNGRQRPAQPQVQQN